MAGEIRLDDSGLSGTRMRDALWRMQAGRCAACRTLGKPFSEKGRAGKLVADHDHETGLLRGLLCCSCNNREGQMRSSLFRVNDPVINAYLADPPAAGLGWMWALPDDWCLQCARFIRESGRTVLDYVSSGDYAAHLALRSTETAVDLYLPQVG